MSERYYHTQVGYLILVAAGGCLLAFSAGLLSMATFRGLDWNTLLGLPLAASILGIAMLFLGTLTTIVRDDAVEIRFGPGLIRKRLALKDVESCRTVRNPWYYGWGIRKMPRGWLFNVSGLDAVELIMRNGKRYRIGTDEPEELQRAISASLAHAGE